MAGRTEVSGGRVGGPRVGIVGAGQLARMLAEAASALGVDTVILAERADDGATGVATEVLPGRPGDPGALERLARRCDVVTFDHELVDLGLVRRLEDSGMAVRPGWRTLEVATDKATMRRRLAAAGLPVPAFEVVDLGAGADAMAAALCAFGAVHGWPVVAKAATGGYDGRGVWPLDGPNAAAEVARRAVDAGTDLLIEAHVAFDAELAVLVARRPSGQAVAWPAVETAQLDGVCREVLVPGRLSPDVAAAAGDLATAVADEVGSTGVLAVELFASGAGLAVNEVAARPHNSGHWTIEGAVTSQFENHLRAVLDLPLGSTAATAPAVACVNVFGSDDLPHEGAGLAAALAVEGAHVHRYGKGPRPGRKLGHVTVCGDDADDVRRRAWGAAAALGTPVPVAVARELEVPR